MQVSTLAAPLRIPSCSTKSPAASAWTRRLTTPADPCHAVLEACATLTDDNGAALGALDQVLHATTLVTNALIERKGSPTALITTAGYRDTLEIGRDVRFDLFDLNIDRPEPLVPRFRRLEVKERILADGSVREPLDESSVMAAVESLRRDGVESIAVCLLHAYRNSLHERRIAELLAQELPGVSVSLSSEVCPEIREFERNGYRGRECLRPCRSPSPTCVASIPA